MSVGDSLAFAAFAFGLGFACGINHAIAVFDRWGFNPATSTKRDQGKE